MKEQVVQSEKELELGDLYKKAKQLIDNARDSIGLMANAVTVYTSFELGRYIVEQEQQGQDRAKYGAKVLDSLSGYLTEEYGKGFSRSNIAGMRQFYITYRDREAAIVQSMIGQLGQMQMYVNYYDRYEITENENPTIGILICKQSDEALVDLTLPKDANIYAKEYKLYLPDKKLLQRKLQEWLDEADENDLL